ncbi:YlxR family protein [Actinospongicola halichondriae]|uniref:YlxR family protein n=1 Tax=Actinospongicola halichondriae TaxID=3236844 RepID=UPI003D45233E
MNPPQRTCVGCHRIGDADTLARFVQQEGTVQFGPTLPGRGAWLCAATLVECAEAAVRRKAFERAFRCPIVPGSVEAAVQTAATSVRPPPQNARG